MYSSIPKLDENLKRLLTTGEKRLCFYCDNYRTGSALSSLAYGSCKKFEKTGLVRCDCGNPVQVSAEFGCDFFIFSKYVPDNIDF